MGRGRTGATYVAGLICNPCTRLVLHRLDSRLRGNDGEKSPGLVGPAAPPGRVWAPCILHRGQAAAPTGMVRTCWVLVGPASEPSSSSRRRGSILGFKKAGFSLLCGNDGEKDPGLVGPATPPGRVWAPCIPHRGQAAAPTGMVRTCWVLVGPASEPSSSSRRRGSIVGF